MVVILNHMALCQPLSDDDAYLVLLDLPVQCPLVLAHDEMRWSALVASNGVLSSTVGTTNRPYTNLGYSTGTAPCSNIDSFQVKVLTPQHDLYLLVVVVLAAPGRNGPQFLSFVNTNSSIEE